VHLENYQNSTVLMNFVLINIFLRSTIIVYFLKLLTNVVLLLIIL